MPSPSTSDKKINRERRPLSGRMIYKIVSRDAWDAAQSAGRFDGAPVDLADGFIHFSTAAQLSETLARHFADEECLTLLACDSAALGADLKWEKSRGGQDFPHLYRPLRMTDILWTRPVALRADGHDTGLLE